jgi:hypothetical protein
MSEGAAGTGQAAELAAQAVHVAAGLKPGTWESVQALALSSIAVSLAELAQDRDGRV